MILSKNNFGTRIKQLRGELTMKEFGHKIGEKVSTISAWENSNNIPISSKLVTIATVFNVSVDYLLGLTDNPQLDNNDAPNIKMYSGGVLTSAPVFLGKMNDESRLDINPHDSLIIYDNYDTLFNSYLKPSIELLHTSRKSPDILIDDVKNNIKTIQHPIDNYVYYDIDPVKHMGWNVLEHMRNIDDTEVINHYMQLICELPITGNDIDGDIFWRILSAKYLTFYYVKYRNQLEQSQTMQWLDFLIYIEETPYTRDEIISTLSNVHESDYTWNCVRESSLISTLKSYTCFTSNRDDYDLETYRPKCLSIVGDYSEMTNEMHMYTNIWKYAFQQVNQELNRDTRLFISNSEDLNGYTYALLTSFENIIATFINADDINQVNSRILKKIYYIINLAPSNTIVKQQMFNILEYRNINIPSFKLLHPYVVTPERYYSFGDEKSDGRLINVKLTPEQVNIIMELVDLLQR